MILNSSTIISLIHFDFELKSGGAIWYGDIIGFNYDLEKGKEITFEELIDQTKLDILQAELTDAYMQQYEVAALEENNWDEEKIPISGNFVLDKDEITFMYQRFQYSGVGGSGMEIKIPYCRLANVLNEQSSVLEKLN